MKHGRTPGGLYSREWDLPFDSLARLLESRLSPSGARASSSFDHEPGCDGSCYYTGRHRDPQGQFASGHWCQRPLWEGESAASADDLPGTPPL